MLTYSLRKSNIPLYEQLYRCIKQDITEGRIPSGSNLPSKRTLAEHLNQRDDSPKCVFPIVSRGLYRKPRAQGLLRLQRRYRTQTISPSHAA